jgi:hypothetical protein
MCVWVNIILSSFHCGNQSSSTPPVNICVSNIPLQPVSSYHCTFIFPLILTSVCCSDSLPGWRWLMNVQDMMRPWPSILAATSSHSAFFFVRPPVLLFNSWLVVVCIVSLIHMSTADFPYRGHRHLIRLLSAGGSICSCSCAVLCYASAKCAVWGPKKERAISGLVGR